MSDCASCPVAGVLTLVSVRPRPIGQCLETGLAVTVGRVQLAFSGL